MRIGVISDTHIPDRTDRLPAEILDVLRGLDLILHAGDIAEQSVLDRLGALAPVVAVKGNRDNNALPWLPDKTIVSAGAWRIGLIHGQRSRTEEMGDRVRYLRGDHRFLDQRRYLRQAFAGETVHCIVFGHTHQAFHEQENGVLLFNPGGVMRSPGGGPSSVGILDVGDAGIAATVIVLQHPPPRPVGVAERVRRAITQR